MVDRCRIALATNDGGFRYLQVAVWTLLKCIDPSRAYEVWVLEGEGGVSDEHKRELLQMVKGRIDIVFKNVDLYLETHRERFLAVRKGRTLMIWARLFIAELMPGVRDNVLYVDTDVHFARDPAEILDVDLGENLIGMVPEAGAGEHPEKFCRRGMPGNMERYCNAGVALLNPAKWRERKVLEQIIEWLDKWRDQQFMWADQDALNAVLCGHIRFLPPKYNYHDGWVERSCRLRTGKGLWRGNPPSEVFEAILDPVIIHYWGRKPWKFNHRPEHRRYELAMREVGWLKGELPGGTFWNRLMLPLWDAMHAAMKRVAAARLKTCSRNALRELQCGQVVS